MFTNKEQLLYYMVQGHVHLSKKDYSFFYNLHNIIRDSSQVTTNQDKLVNKLVVKYQRQLKKLGHDVEVLSNLQYKNKLVNSLEEFLEARIYIDDNDICLKSPFNNKFIQDMRKTQLNDFGWSKQEKLYRAKYTTYNLKLIYTKVLAHYEKVSLCPKVTELIAQTVEYGEIKYWQPTLVRKGNNFYIMAINDSLYQAIKDIQINDEPATVYKLSTYGIMIDKSVTLDDKLLMFAGKFNIAITPDELDETCRYIKALNIKNVILNRDLTFAKNMSKEITDKLEEHNIPYSHSIANSDSDDNILIHSSYSDHNPDHVYKTIKVINNRPIKVR